MSDRDNLLEQHLTLQKDMLDSELVQLPSPPVDLPRPWNWTNWKRTYRFSFFIVLFGLWFLGRLFDIEVINLFAGSCGVTISLYLILGLYLINRYQMRGYIENYSRRANKLLNQGITRYRNLEQSENFLQIFPRYLVNDEKYYLVWYVPKAGSVLSSSLKPGSQPLIFNSQGQWLNDELLFSKTSLMWSIALNFAQSNYQKEILKAIKDLKNFIDKTLSSVPDYLKINEKIIIDHGLEQEYDLIIDGCPVVLALYRNSLDTNRKIKDWGDKYGWDSITEIRYEDCLRLQNGTRELEEARDSYKQRHNHSAITQAAEKMVLQMREKDLHSGAWKHRKQLELGLRSMTEEFSNDIINFRFENGMWIPSDEMVEAYRSRVDYARMVDQKKRM